MEGGRIGGRSEGADSIADAGATRELRMHPQPDTPRCSQIRMVARGIHADSESGMMVGEDCGGGREGGIVWEAHLSGEGVAEDVHLQLHHPARRARVSEPRLVQDAVIPVPTTGRVGGARDGIEAHATPRRRLK